MAATRGAISGSSQVAVISAVEMRMTLMYTAARYRSVCRLCAAPQAGLLSATHFAQDEIGYVTRGIARTTCYSLQCAPQVYVGMCTRMEDVYYDANPKNRSRAGNTGLSQSHLKKRTQLFSACHSAQQGAQRRHDDW